MAHRQEAPVPSSHPDDAAISEFARRVFADWASALTVLLAALGDRHQLFQALSLEPASSSELARRTRLDERYLQEWLAAMAASGYVDFDSTTERFGLPPASVPVLALDGTPVSIGGVYQWLLGVLPALEAVSAAFRSGAGVEPDAYGPDLLPGMERIASAMYTTSHVTEWLSLLPRLQARLATGVDVADIGCGSGRALITLAQSFPRSRFIGYDGFGPQVERARANAEAAGVAGRVSFEQAEIGAPDHGSSALPATGADLVLAFDVLHDAADPSGVLAAVRRAVRPDGTLLCLELAGRETLTDNLNPMGQAYYAVSLLHCLSVSLAAGGPGLGTLGLTEQRLRHLATTAGFRNVHRLADVPPAHALYEVTP